MRAPVLIALLVALIIAAVAFREGQLRWRMDAMAVANRALTQNVEALTGQLVEAQGKIESLQQAAAAVPVAHAGWPANAGVSNRIAALESRVQSLTKELARQNPASTVPEYDPANPPPPDLPDTNAPAKRNWGEEQIIGPPDTHTAGDAITAWASKQANAGPEWLTAGFDNAVDIAEVRVRESFNPGAISKITAMANGQEVTLWEGTAASSKGIREFVVRPTFSVTANSVTVHMDTTRVKGWSEVDAVELVGRDGSRQWASSASASSTYAPNRVKVESYSTTPPE